MKTNIASIAMAVLMLGCASCSEHWAPPTETEGSLSLGSMIVDVKENANVVVLTGSRATADVNTFEVTIYDKAGDPVNSWLYGSMPEIVTLSVGEGYVVKVRSHKVEKAEWEKPYYYGESKPFAIEKNKITEVSTIEAAFASLKVTVEFSDDLMAVLGDDVKVSIESNDEGLINFGVPEVTAQKAAYFEVLDDSPTMVAHFTGTVGGAYIDKTMPFSDVKAGEHRIVRYDVKLGPEAPAPSGSITPGVIDIDTSIVEVDVDGNVNIVEDPTLDSSDRPGQEDPIEPENPDDPIDPTPGEDVISFTKGGENDNFSLDGVNTVKQYDANYGDVIVNINAEKGVKNLFVTIVTDSEEFLKTLSDLGLQNTFDLANPGDLEGDLGPDGLNLPITTAVVGKTTVPFDITGFIGMLDIYTGNHTFKLRAVDAENNENSMSLVFKVVP